MVSARDEEAESASDDANAWGTDGGAAGGIDEVVFYGVVRRAVEDAILGVIGTLLLVGVAFVLTRFGVALAVESSSLMEVAFGGTAIVVGPPMYIVVGLYIGAATLRVIPQFESGSERRVPTASTTRPPASASSRSPARRPDTRR